MALWASLFIEFWKRRQYKLAYEWDLTDMEGDVEPVRPQYRAKAKKLRENDKSIKKRLNPITLKQESYVPIEEKVGAKVGAMVTVFFSITVVLIAVIGVVIYRLAIAQVMATGGFFKSDSENDFVQLLYEL